MKGTLAGIQTYNDRAPPNASPLPISHGLKCKCRRHTAATEADCRAQSRRPSREAPGVVSLTPAQSCPCSAPCFLIPQLCHSCPSLTIMPISGSNATATYKAQAHHKQGTVWAKVLTKIAELDEKVHT